MGKAENQRFAQSSLQAAEGRGRTQVSLAASARVKMHAAAGRLPHSPPHPWCNVPGLAELRVQGNVVSVSTHTGLWQTSERVAAGTWMRCADKPGARNEGTKQAKWLGQVASDRQHALRCWALPRGGSPPGPPAMYIDRVNRARRFLILGRTELGQGQQAWAPMHESGLRRGPWVGCFTPCGATRGWGRRGATGRAALWCKQQTHRHTSRTRKSFASFRP